VYAPGWRILPNIIAMHGARITDFGRGPWPRGCPELTTFVSPFVRARGRRMRAVPVAPALRPAAGPPRSSDTFLNDFAAGSLTRATPFRARSLSATTTARSRRPGRPRQHIRDQAPQGRPEKYIRNTSALPGTAPSDADPPFLFSLPARMHRKTRVIIGAEVRRIRDRRNHSLLLDCGCRDRTLYRTFVRTFQETLRWFTPDGPELTSSMECSRKVNRMRSRRRLSASESKCAKILAHHQALVNPLIRPHRDPL
jgi:hypothetical protein